MKVKTFQMDKEGQLHSFQHSLKHLDPCSQVIVRDIMEFLLHDETINLELLRQTLLNQVAPLMF